MNIAIIFAAGIGSRMKYKYPKQYMPVDDEKPILAYTLERFNANKDINKIILVVKDDHKSIGMEICNRYKINKLWSMVAGGDSAHASIICGLDEAKRLGANDDDIVLLHDGVRPVVDSSTIRASIDSAVAYGSGITSIPAYETVACSDDGNKIDTVTNRSDTYILQAPQTFRFGYIYNLNQRAIADDMVGKVVDQAQLCAHYGDRPHLIAGLRGNVKITVMLDYLNFKNLVKSGYYEEIVNG